MTDSFSSSLLSAYYVLDTVLDTEIRMLSRHDPCTRGAQSWERKQITGDCIAKMVLDSDKCVNKTGWGELRDCDWGKQGGQGAVIHGSGSEGL